MVSFPTDFKYIRIMKRFKIFLISILLFYLSNILIWFIYAKNQFLKMAYNSTNSEAIAIANDTVTKVDEGIFNIGFNIGYGLSNKTQLIPILIIFSVYIFTLLNMSKLHWKWVDKNILDMFFLKIFVFFFVWFIGWAMGSFYNIVILELNPSAGINSFFLIFAPIVAYYLSFSEWANKNIWKWVDENIMNIFSKNNSISTSERNEAIGYLKQGNTEYKNGRFTEAIKYYTKAIEIDSSFKEAHNNRDKARKKL